MLRVSSYIIFVDLDDDSVMLLHGYAGSIDIVPRSVADLLRSRSLSLVPISIPNFLKGLQTGDTLPNCRKRRKTTISVVWLLPCTRRICCFTPPTLL